jgi:hypothetical protein
MPLVLLLLTLALAPAVAQQACTIPSPLRVGVYNTDGYDRLGFTAERMAAMAMQLPQVAESLDVLCLNDLRSAQRRDTALANFDRNVWNIYQPERLSGCRNACQTNQTISAMNFTLPFNKWVEYCSLTPLPGVGSACSQVTGGPAAYAACLDSFCPWIAPPVLNEECRSCIMNQPTGVSQTSNVFNCSANYIGSDAQRCNDAGATIVSRYPFLATEYRLFPRESVANQDYGVDNWGVSYAKIQTPLGPTHLFCSNFVTPSIPTFSYQRLPPAVAQDLNAIQTQDVLAFINSKTNGEPAIFLGDTGSGPAVVSSPTGPANAQWANAYTLLESGGLTNALLANLGPDSLPASAAACTFGCGTNDAAFSTHIMTSGSGPTPDNSTAPLCSRNGSTFLTTATATTANGPVPLSRHFGVRADIGLQYRVSPTVTWPQPASLPHGSALGNAQLNATASVPGAFTYTPPAGTVLPIGANQPLQAHFTPTDLINYAPVTASNSITITATNGAKANIVVQRTLTRDSNNHVVVNLILVNNGGSTASNVTVSTLRVGATSGVPLPRSFGSIAAGASATASFTIPNSSALPAGASSTLRVTGAFTGGSFNSSGRIALP